MRKGPQGLWVRLWLSLRAVLGPFLGSLRRFPPVDPEGSGGRAEFGDPEGVPDAGRPQNIAEQKGSRNDDDEVPAQGDHQGRHSHAQTLQSSGGDHRGGGYEEADADDAQGSRADLNGLGIVCEQSHDPAGAELAESGSHHHDGGRQGHGSGVDLLDTPVLSGAVIVADQRTDSLNETVGGEIKERLKFIVDPQNQHVGLGERREDRVQGGDQHRRQGQVQGSRDSDGVKPSGQSPVPGNSTEAHTDRDRIEAVKEQVDDEGQNLSDAGGQGGALDAQCGDRAQSEDQDRIENDVGHAAGQHTEHRDGHLAHGLINLFIKQVQ